MKIYTHITAVLLALCLSLNVIADDTDAGKEYPREVNIPHALSRATVNMLTAWLEVPRRMVLKINESPFWGYMTGAMEGSFLASCRIILSAADFAMLGTTGPSAYDPVDLPEFIWDAQWNPYPEVIETPAPEKTEDNQNAPKFQFITPTDDLI